MSSGGSSLSISFSSISRVSTFSTFLGAGLGFSILGGLGSALGDGGDGGAGAAAAAFLASALTRLASWAFLSR